MNEYLLFWALFFPRISLWVAWLNGVIPPNSIPLVGDFFLTLLFPRILMLIYIGSTEGIGGWFVAHLIMLLITWGSSSSVSVSKSD